MPFKRILVPVDLSENSMRAVDTAAGLAKEAKGEVTLLYVVEPIYFGGPPSEYAAVPDVSLMMAQQRLTAQKGLAAAAAALAKKRVRCRVLVDEGSPFERILAVAKKGKADLIAMSTHGRTGLSHLFLGSVADKVVRMAPCPVLTLRATAAGKRRAPKRKR